MNSVLQLIYDYAMIALEVYQFLILLYVFASWFGGLPRNRFGYFIHDLIAPVIRLCRKIPYKLGPIDFSPIYAFLLIGFLKVFIITLFQGTLPQ